MFKGISRFFLKVFGILLLLNFVMPVEELFSRDRVPARTKRYLKKARKEFDKGNFPLSAVYYREALEKSPDNFDANMELGYLYYKETGKNDSAVYYFDRAEMKMPNPPVPELYYYKAQAFRLGADYNKAMVYYTLFSPFIKSRGDKLKNEVIHAVIDCRYGKNVHIRRDSISVINLGEGINSEFDEYTPVVSSNDSVLMFTARLKRNVEGGAMIDEDDKYLEDMYISFKRTDRFSSFMPFRSQPVTALIKSSDDHESVVSLSWDGKNLFTYKKNALWISEFQNGFWSVSKKMNENINMGAIQRHACISPDGTKLYFSSDKEGGFGGFDLYVSEKQPDGSWGKGRNMGKAVNTALDEDAPVVSADGERIYFSSKGHLGYGGYDVFILEKEGDYITITNFGEPVNSSGDDIYFNPNQDGTIAYFASNRDGGKGGMDLYKALITPSKFSNCVEYKPIPFNVNLSGKNYVKGNISELDLTWTMPDGTELKGSDIKYTFPRPGKYTITLNAGNIQNGAIVLANKEIVVDTVVDTHIEFISPDTSDINEEFSLNARPSYVKDSKINSVYWELGDGRRMDSTTVLVSYPSPGEYEVRMEIEAENEYNGKMKHYCISKKLYIRTEEEKLAAEEILRRKEREKFVADSIAEANRVALLAEEQSKAKKQNMDAQAASTRQSSEVVEKLEFLDIQLKTVYFDVNKSNLRKDAMASMKENIKILKANPEVGILIAAYSDTRGSTVYNQKLAGKRADTAVKYLLKQGIKKSRIISVVSHGETGIDCDPGQPCPEEELQKSRRVEFKVFRK